MPSFCESHCASILCSVILSCFPVVSSNYSLHVTQSNVALNRHDFEAEKVSSTLVTPLPCSLRECCSDENLCRRSKSLVMRTEVNNNSLCLQISFSTFSGNFLAFV